MIWEEHGIFNGMVFRSCDCNWRYSALLNSTVRGFESGRGSESEGESESESVSESESENESESSSGKWTEGLV